MSDLLAIYLTDHRAGAAAGSRRMRRLADAETSASDGAELTRIADEVEEDRQTLSRLLEDLHVSPRWYKAAAARLAEALGLLKTNGRVVRRSPLTSVVELEALRMGVTGKIALWQTLQHTDVGDQLDLDELVQRAESQLRRLEAAHARRAAALVPSEPRLGVG